MLDFTKKEIEHFKLFTSKREKRLRNIILIFLLCFTFVGLLWQVKLWLHFCQIAGIEFSTMFVGDIAAEKLYSDAILRAYLSFYTSLFCLFLFFLTMIGIWLNKKFTRWKTVFLKVLEWKENQL